MITKIKSQTLALLLCVVFPASIGTSQGESLKEGDQLPTLLTAKGRTYRNVVIRKIEPNGLRIFHDSGATLIPPEELPEYANLFASPEALEIIRDRLAKQERLWHETQGKAMEEIAEADAARRQNRIDQRAAQLDPTNQSQGQNAKAPAGGISRVKLLARTVAMGRKELNSSYYWTGDSPQEEEFIYESTKQVFRHRKIAIDIINTGQNSQLVVEVFWLGATAKTREQKRGQTEIIRYSAKIVETQRSQKATFHVTSDYHNFDSQLTYLQRDPRKTKTWKGFVASSWGGYDYKGWIVRVSDGKGRILASQASRPPQLAFAQDFEAPCMR